MKRYLEHIKSKEPHERRQHAMQIAGATTAAVFVIWIATLGVRVATPQNQVAGADETSLTAAAAASPYTQGNQLIVASSTNY